MRTVVVLPNRMKIVFAGGYGEIVGHSEMLARRKTLADMYSRFVKMLYDEIANVHTDYSPDDDYGAASSFVSVIGGKIKSHAKADAAPASRAY